MSNATERFEKAMGEYDTDTTEREWRRANARLEISAAIAAERERDHQEWLRQDAARINAGCGYW